MQTGEELAANLLLQLEKPDLNSKNGFEAIKNVVNELILHDFGRLVQLLYRVDVPEALVKKSLQQNQATDAAEIITRLLIDRQLQKAKLRFNPKSTDVPENEKW